MSSRVATRGWIGRPLPRAEDARFLRGEACFVGDLRLPGMLHAAFVRSPYGHARLLAVDAEAALASPGVRAVLTGDDVAPLVDPFPVLALRIRSCAQCTRCWRGVGCATPASRSRSSSPTPRSRLPTPRSGSRST